MKTFLEFITEAKRPKPAPKYKGTPVVVDTHGTHSTPNKYKGTPVVVDTHGSHANREKKKRLDEKSLHDLDFHTASKPREHASFNAWKRGNDNDHLGWHVSNVHGHMQEHYPFDEVPHDDEVRKYTDHSKDLNHSLLDHYKLGHTPSHYIEGHHVPHLDAAINHHELKHDLHVYSGVGFHPGREAAKHPDNKIHLPAYTSTSIDKNTAHTFAHGQEDETSETGHTKHILHIHLKHGQKGLYVGDHSSVGNEHEFILPRHTTLKIHPKPSIVPPSPYSSQPHPIHVWHAHVTDNEIETDPRQLKMHFGHAAPESKQLKMNFDHSAHQQKPKSSDKPVSKLADVIKAHVAAGKKKGLS